tara:strand:+ start:974 stop:1507 length:534 start_codon:yes stop_codon:yes gene_type:complete
MKKFFQFKGTINGSTFILRFLFMIILSFPFFILCFIWGFSLIFNYVDLDLLSSSSLSYSESNAIGEKAGEKIAEEIQEIGATKWFSKNLGFVWIASLFLSVVPLIWFGLSTYYKRVSALFYSNRVKAFILFIIVESALDMISLNSGSSLVYWICTIMGFIIFFYLVLKNSPIGEHDG